MKAFASNILTFAEFEIDTDRQLLLRDGEIVALNSKAFDLLLALVEERGSVVSKNDLLDRVWPDQFVEENNLTVQIAAIRKALGEQKDEKRFIVTVPGRGYKFIAELRTDDSDLVIERHTVERIVIEEDVVTEMVAPQMMGRRWSRALGSTGRFVFISAASLLLLAASGYFFYRSNAGVSQAGPGPYAGIVTERIFAVSGGVPHRAVIAPDGKSIAYVLRSNGKDSLRYGDVETGNSIQLTQPSERLFDSLALSPDGRTLFFTALDESHPFWTLMRVSVFGGAVKDLVAGVHGSISLSPDGKHVAFLRRNANERKMSLLIADAETGMNERTLLQSSDSRKLMGSGVAWSPDGGSIAVGMSDENGKGCFVMGVDVGDGTVTKIVEENCKSRTNLAWLPQGDGIVMHQNTSATGTGETWLVPFPAGPARRLTNTAATYSPQSLSASSDGRICVLQVRTDSEIRIADLGYPSDSKPVLSGSRVSGEGSKGIVIAPDGMIIYASITGESRALWQRSADGSSEQQLTPSEPDSEDQQVSVTRDNRFLVFESRRSGSVEIWRSNRDGTGMLQLTSGGGNSSPAVTPDGASVVYASQRNGKSTIWRIPIEGGVPTQLTTMETSWPDVSPDGKFIVSVIGRATDGSDKQMALIPITGGQPTKVFTAALSAFLSNRPRWSPDGRSIVYKDEVAGLWRQDIDKGAPERISGFDEFRVHHFNFSAEGRLVYSGGVPKREIVIIENFR